MTIRIILSLAVALGFSSLHATADTHYVSPAGSHTSPYTSWVTAATNIQHAVNAASGGDAVLITNGTYSLSSEIVVANAILIESVNGPGVTIVDGNGGVTSNRCFNLGSSACVVSGLTITNGYTTGDGGGVYCASPSPMLRNCVLVGNSAIVGGGMYDGTANNCTISGNTAGFVGGGMYWGTANNCTISGNTAEYGGGMIFGTANNCTISGNTASFQYGGMYDGTANNCIVWYNTAPLGSDIAGTITKHTCSPDVTHGSTGNITNAPSFVSYAIGDYRLTDGSPCINAGSNTYVVGSTDLDGNARILDGSVDMGAYEQVSATADSDSDGLSDYDEIFVYGTDPLIINYRLVASGGTNGMISPAGTNYVLIGSTTSFEVTADPYYHIAVVQTNGMTLAGITNMASTNVVWNNVVSDGTLSATFSADLATNNVPHWWLAGLGYTNDFNSAVTNDLDGDGLSNGREYELGTGPDDDDSDGDGLKDGDEVDDYGTDPRVKDSDGDGYEDGLEVSNGLDPRFNNTAFADNAADFGLYASNAVLDLGVGVIDLGVSNATAVLRVQLWQKEGSGIWTHAGDAVEWQQPADTNQQFFQIRAEP